jgi:hypothetical protein
MIRTQDDESVVTEIESVITDGLAPISCIFCNFVTCIEFDMDNHLLGNHRTELLRLPIRGSFDLRIAYAIDEGKRIASTSTLDKTFTKPKQHQVQEVQGIKLWSQLDKTNFKPIITVEIFFSDNQSLPLPYHSFEQSPCYPIIGAKPAENHVLYSCEIHRKIRNINLESIEHHCKYLEPERHFREITSRLPQTLVNII